MPPTRREIIQTTASGLFAYSIAAQLTWLTPAQAKARSVPLQILSANEASILERLGDIFLPGASEAGLAYFIDKQLVTPEEECLLMLKYLGVNAPFSDFYRTCAASMDVVSQDIHKKTFLEINDQQTESLVKSIGSGNPDKWQGPPAPLFYFTLRSDAIDVVYGTEDGFKALGISYLPHINPAEAW